MDRYLKTPILFDLVVCLMVSVGYFYLNIYCNYTFILPQSIIDSSISDLTSTVISLAGFVLASLTIIVTFKDNVTHREKASKEEEKLNLEEDNQASTNESSGLVLLFTSKHYKPIVGIFTWAVFVFLVIYLTLSVFRFVSPWVLPLVTSLAVINGVILTALTIFRTLLILGIIIKLQVNDKTKL